ncbi:MAG: ABC transporter substrate-binding protein [Proteobacteria bacterium]|nr:ABC transporter substrate-binding protein [Pseudomonadota bacterium]
MSEELNVIVFPGGFNLPLWAGAQCGAFARQGLHVNLHFTTNSAQQLAGLARGDWEIGLTGFDNIVAYQEGQGEAVLAQAPDLFAFMGGDNAFLRLVVQPDIRSYEQLRGATLSVDALTTGFAFVLREMLARNGVPDAEMRFEPAGGVMQRFTALIAGRHAGTLLLTPFELLAQNSGLRVLQSAAEIIPRYQGICGVARRSWAKANAPTLVAFIRAYVAGLDWLYDRGNEAVARALLVENVKNLSTELASTTCSILVGEPGGFERKARLDRPGIAAVLELRRRYGLPRKALADARIYDDLAYYREAVPDA